MLEFTHDIWLAAASLAVALMAGFSGLSLTQGASALDVPKRKLTVVVASFVLGGGIWSMHFVAMLGLRLPIPFYYDALITLVSALVAILMVGLALLILHFRRRTPAMITLSGSIVGVGIAAMHYIGMQGMEICRPVFSAAGIAVSVLAALLLGNLAIWTAYGARTHRNTLLGTAVFGASVFAVHFIAMAGTGFQQTGALNFAGPALSNDALAMGVALSAFVISGAFLLTGASLFKLDSEPEAAVAPEQPGPPAPTRAAQAMPRALPIPYEKDGRTQFTDSAAVAAVRAEGHYTLLYLGREKLFCPWSISEAATRLAHTRFIRAHRSYLINPVFVSEFQRTKDTGICLFASVDSLKKVPVSRSRLQAVREALGL